MFCRGYKVVTWLRFWSYVWSTFWILSLLEMLMFGWDSEVDVWSRFWRWNLIKIFVWTCDMNSTLGSVVPLAMFFVISLLPHLLKRGRGRPATPFGTLESSGCALAFIHPSSSQMERERARAVKAGKYGLTTQSLRSTLYLYCLQQCLFIELS